MNTTVLLIAAGCLIIMLIIAIILLWLRNVNIVTMFATANRATGSLPPCGV